MAIYGNDDDNLINGTNTPDIIIGLGGNDTLNGGDWNDQLFGGIGNDVLDGGTGADTLEGGVGYDTYIVDDVGDQISESSSKLDNADTVISTISWTLGEYLENLTLIGDVDINGTGNELDNNLVGNVGDNILRGNGGNDQLFGNGGSDQLFGDDGFDGLFGGGGNDTLYGGNGEDYLEGGEGSDLLDGGDSNDTYFVDNVGDRIVESAPNDSSNNDIVASYVTWTLSDNLEELWLLGDAPMDGTGNALNNLLIGNNFNNTLVGGDGDDTLQGAGGINTLDGGAGNDTYFVELNATDTIIEGVNAGIDTVFTTFSWTLGANLENLTLQKDSSAINGIGNDLNNTITGNDGSNLLHGKQGNDTLLGGDSSDRLVGGADSDVLTGGDGADRFVRVYASTGIDTITDFQVGEDLLCFSARGFGGDLVKRSVLDESQFTLGTAATNTSDRFIYDNTTGALFFDVDGTGASEQVQIANLQTGLALSNADIYIMA
jgi:Ca2+-binding RTX toxin-like protein